MSRIQNKTISIIYLDGYVYELNRYAKSDECIYVFIYVFWAKYDALLIDREKSCLERYALSGGWSGIRRVNYKVNILLDLPLVKYRR